MREREGEYGWEKRERKNGREGERERERGVPRETKEGGRCRVRKRLW